MAMSLQERARQAALAKAAKRGRRAAAIRAALATKRVAREARLASEGGVRVPKPFKSDAELDAEVLARLTTNLAPKRGAKLPREKLDPSIDWPPLKSPLEKQSEKRAQKTRKREREKMEREELARERKRKREQERLERELEGEKARKKELAALKSMALRVQRRRKALQEARKERKRLEGMMPQTGALPVSVDAAIVGLLSLQTWQG